ncbi:MAG TPA: hypothetical protein VK178_17630 [Opitutaceae bacterium]|nr:hypothetical protein [Opitutaceae bacterium]
MTPTDAFSAIAAAMARMSTLYGRTLFDEWVVVRLGPSNATVQTYEGPRLGECLAAFAKDVAPLRREASDRAHEPGDFDFARAAAGTQFDALLKLGADSYLLCNNTGSSMEQIRADPNWLKAQVPFANLAERFRIDPVVFG